MLAHTPHPLQTQLKLPKPTPLVQITLLHSPVLRQQKFYSKLIERTLLLSPIGIHHPQNLNESKPYLA